jgi:hypothetical protein
MRPTGSLGALWKRREASKRAREPPGAITLGKGVDNLHTSTTTYLALAAATSMLSMLAAVVVGRAEEE